MSHKSVWIVELAAILAAVITLSGCAGAATPLPAASPPTPSLATMSLDELRECVAEAIAWRQDF